MAENIELGVSLSVNNLKETMGKVASGLKETMGKTASYVPGGASFAGISTAGSATLAAGAGAGAAIMILKMINDSIENVKKEIAKGSPAFDAMQNYLDKIYNLVLMPMGNVIMQLQRPYLRIMLQRLRQGMVASAAIMGRTDIGMEEKAALIAEEMKAAMLGIKQVTFGMNQVIQPILGDIAGFQASLNISMNNWLTGIGATIGGFFDGLSSGLAPLETGTAQIIKDGLEKGDYALSEIGPWLFNKIKDYVGGFLTLPGMFPTGGQRTGDIMDPTGTMRKLGIYTPPTGPRAGVDFAKEVIILLKDQENRINQGTANTVKLQGSMGYF